MIGLVAEHIIVYAKNSEELKRAGVGKIDLTGDFSNPDNDPRGDWASKPWAVASGQSGTRYQITTPAGIVYDEEWMGDENTFKALLADNRIYFPRNGNGKPRKKYFRHEREEEGQCATNWWSHEEFGHNQGASDALYKLFGMKNVFNNPKPVELIRGLIQLSNAKDNDIILDFFSGTSTTAHAVMQLNAEDKRNRKYIMVQLDEDLDESYEKADSRTKETIKNAIGFLDSIDKPHLLTELGKERIRRAAKKIKEETGADIDYGFRVYRVDSSNMKDVYFTPDKLQQVELFDLASNIKEDRTGEDLLIQVMLELGLELSLPMQSKQLEGKTVHYVAGNALIACFDDHVPDTVIKQIAADRPLRVVFRDSSFEDDSARINVEELFRMLAPGTEIQVL
jgi:adenine-specific DNA-methyltransferase